MLSAFRKRKNNPLVIMVLGLVGLLMVFFGISIEDINTATYAAKVNGEEISDQQNRVAYSREFNSRRQGDPTYDRSKAQRDELRENVLYRLITTKLLAQEARRMGLDLDDATLRDVIIQQFTGESGFSREEYERRLNSMGLTDFQFENQMRDELLAEKLTAIIQSVSVSDAEMKQAFDANERRVDISFVQVAKREFEGQVGTVQQADVEAWKAREGSAEEIKKYYTKMKAQRYDVPEKVCAKHILIKAEEGMPPDLAREARERASAAHKMAAGPKGFDAAVLAYSEDPTKNSGGDLGCFSTGQMLPEVERAAFGMKAGEMSPVVKSPLGFHIVKVTKLEEPVRKKLEDVEEEIARELTTVGRAGELAKEKAVALHALAKEKGSLEEAVTITNEASKTSLQVFESGPFAHGRDFLPKLGKAEKVAAAAWKLTAEAPMPEGPIESEGGWVVIRLKERIEPKPEAFEDQRGRLLFTLSAPKRGQAVEGWSKWLRERGEVLINPRAMSYDDSQRRPGT